MNHECDMCKKQFKHKYLLEKHYTRKYKCKSIIIDKNENSDFRLDRIDNELSETKKELNVTKNILSDLIEKINEETYTTNLIECEFCSKTFNFKTNLTKHKKVCKNKIDDISIYEKELKTNPKIAKNNLSCAFCNKQYNNKKSLSQHNNRGCLEKYDYKADLKERVLENRRAAAANITNNNTTNNINIIMPQMNTFGNENLDYLTTKSLLKELEQYVNTNDIGKIVNKFTKLIHANPAHPENHNVLFKSLNSGYAQVYTNNGFEDQQATTVQDDIFQKVHNLLSTKGFDHCNNEFLDVCDELDSNYGELMEEVKEGKSTRPLSKCRNAIKAALHTHSNEIEQTQKLTIQN